MGTLDSLYTSDPNVITMSSPGKRSFVPSEKGPGHASSKPSGASAESPIVVSSQDSAVKLNFRSLTVNEGDLIGERVPAVHNASVSWGRKT